MHAWTFDAIGTGWQIDSREPLAADVQAEVLACVEEFDRTWSRFRPDSVVSQMAERAGVWPISNEIEILFDWYDELFSATDAAVNPLIGNALAGLGYDADYTLQHSGQPAAIPDWMLFDWADQRISTREPVLLDIGAAGKGLLVDLVQEVVGDHTRQFSIDASGDIFHNDAPIRVALEHPLNPTMAIGVAMLHDEMALCASAVNRRAWGDGLHHILDARTGRPTRDVIATWVVAPQSCMRADGLATAYFFAGPEALLGGYPHEFVRMFADGRLESSPGFPGEVFG